MSIAITILHFYTPNRPQSPTFGTLTSLLSCPASPAGAMLLRWLNLVSRAALPSAPGGSPEVDLPNKGWFGGLRGWAPGERADCAACHSGPPPACFFGAYNAHTTCGFCSKGIARHGGYTTNAHPVRNCIRQRVALSLRKPSQPMARRTLRPPCPFECWVTFQDMGWGKGVLSKGSSKSLMRVELELVGEVLEAFLELQSSDVAMGWGSAIYCPSTGDLRVCTRLLLVFTRRTTKAGNTVDAVHAHFDAAILSHSKAVRLDDRLLTQHKLWARYSSALRLSEHEDPKSSLTSYIKGAPARMVAAGFGEVAHLVDTEVYLLPPCNI